MGKDVCDKRQEFPTLENGCSRLGPGVNLKVRQLVCRDQPVTLMEGHHGNPGMREKHGHFLVCCMTAETSPMLAIKRIVAGKCKIDV